MILGSFRRARRRDTYEPGEEGGQLVELGILSLGDLQRDQRTGRPHGPVDRMAEILGYAVLADQLGLDVFALGEHHSADFFTSSPAVVLAAAAARTDAIRLTSATTLLGWQIRSGCMRTSPAWT